MVEHDLSVCPQFQGTDFNYAGRTDALRSNSTLLGPLERLPGKTPYGREIPARPRQLTSTVRTALAPPSQYLLVAPKEDALGDNGNGLEFGRESSFFTFVGISRGHSFPLRGRFFHP